jgi:hypothetical protein
VEDREIQDDDICGCKVRRKNRQITDKYYDHAAGCADTEGVSTAKIVGHTVACRQIGNLIQCATQAAVQYEPQRVFGLRDPNSLMRLDILGLNNGCLHGFDFTSVHPVPGSGLTMNQAMKPGRAAEKAARAKEVKFDDICHRNNVKVFCAVAYESGGTCNKSWDVEKERLFSMMPGGNHAGFRNYWNSVISIAVQTGVANKQLAWKHKRFQKERNISCRGYPIRDVEYLTEIGSYKNNRI